MLTDYCVPAPDGYGQRVRHGASHVKGVHVYDLANLENERSPILEQFLGLDILRPGSMTALQHCLQRARGRRMLTLCLIRTLPLHFLITARTVWIFLSSAGCSR
jgi:hypothetical protein